jgi:hypothetical protein
MRAPLTIPSIFAFLLVVPVLHAESPSFEQREAPLLRQRCLSCHNPDKNKGELDLSTRESALEGGNEGPPLVPNKPNESLLLTKVTGTKPTMPRGGDPLSAEQVADQRQWIAAGTPWPANTRLASHPFLECLDAADANLSTPVRTTTNTALQALALLNDPFLVRQAEHFAVRLAQVEGGLPLPLSVAISLVPLSIGTLSLWMVFGKEPSALRFGSACS